MSNRAQDWYTQALYDLEMAEEAVRSQRHERACFAAQQSAEKAVKALHLCLGQEAWGHVVARLLEDLLPHVQVPADLIDRAKVLDTYYIPTRYPNSHAAGAPHEHYTALQVRRLSVMPVRSLSSSVMKWPDARTVHQAMAKWAKETAEALPEVVAIGYFGSYARGDWGVGSDVDIVVIVCSSDEPPVRRPLQFNTLSLPVPADVIVYTLGEWQKIDPSSRFGKVMQNEVKWVFQRSQ